MGKTDRNRVHRILRPEKSDPATGFGRWFRSGRSKRISGRGGLRVEFACLAYEVLESKCLLVVDGAPPIAAFPAVNNQSDLVSFFQSRSIPDGQPVLVGGKSIVQYDGSGQKAFALAGSYVVALPDLLANPGDSLAQFQARYQSALPAITAQVGDDLARGLGQGVAQAELLGGGAFVVQAPVGMTSLQVQSALRAVLGVQSIEPNQILFRADTTPNDTYYPQQLGVQVIRAPAAWDISRGSSSVVVGIIDGGIKYNHPDLAANIWTNSGEISGDGIDNDNNGLVDDVHGYNFIDVGVTDPMDFQGHGTHVAGIVGAIGNNAIGVAGVNWTVSLMALKIFDTAGNSTLAAALNAINYATFMKQNGVNLRVLNASWGGPDFSNTLKSAIDTAGQNGILFVAAAGNAAHDIELSPTYPASFTSTNILSVAATTSPDTSLNDSKAPWSNYGSVSVDLAAPGTNIVSTWSNDFYVGSSGTSMAAPMVAGAAALAWAVNSSLTVSQMISDIKTTVDIIPNLSGLVVTGGRLNVFSLVQLAQSQLVQNPALTVNPATFSVPENSSAGTNVGTVTYTDTNVGATITWSMTAGNTGSAFAIDSTGKITVLTPAALNFESTPTFTLTVQATDNGSPSLNGSATVTVNLTNVNEPPVVTGATFSLAENSTAGTVVGTVAASDPDGGTVLAWSITAGNTGSAFAIDGTGKITVLTPAALNFESTPSFTLTVRATDNGSPSLNGSATITVNLTNVNELPVVSGATFSLAENSTAGTVVGTVAATDPDAGTVLAWSITGGNTGSAFAIDGTGKITVLTPAALNFESTPTFTLTVQATDNGSPSLSGSATVTVNLTNVNEPPVVSGATFSLAENSTAGTVVGTVAATDPDAGTVLAWSITGGNTGSAFAIDSTGKITVLTPAALNFESTPSFTLTVQASDNGSPSLSGSATVTVNLTNVNEPPVVTGATFSLAENSTAGTVVGTVTASDPDAGTVLAWSITAGNTGSAFAIDGTGKITVLTPGALNFESTPTFSLTVQATDNGSPSLNGSATITVNLTNVNEPPVVSGATFSLAENSTAGTVVGTVAATDPDAGTVLAWSITGGNTGSAFAIDGTGKITVLTPAALNFESTPSFTLTVQATDNGSPSLNGSATITVNLTNVNEPPVVTGATFSLAENSTAGTVVGTVTASDPDAGTVLAWSITAGNTGSAFAIDSTGKITVLTPAALNYQANPTFNLTVQATDNGSPSLSGSAVVTINLTPVATVQIAAGGVVINGDQPGSSSQRSQVRSIVVSFNGLVNISAGAFEVLKTDAGNATGGVTFSTATVNGKTVATINFAGAYAETNGSLQDGTYQLAIHSALIHDVVTGLELDGDGNGLAGGDRAVDQFFRLFGDADGDRDVDNLDAAIFRTTYLLSSPQSGYLWYMDFDSSGSVTGFDSDQFGLRYGHTI